MYSKFCFYDCIMRFRPRFPHRGNHWALRIIKNVVQFPVFLFQTTVSSSQEPSGGSSSLRRQHTYPPASSHYGLQEAPSFTSTPSLYHYPTPVSHIEHLLVQGSSPSMPGLPTSHYAASLIPKNSIGGVVHGLSAHYQQHYPTHPYVSTSTTRGGGAYSSYQLSPRRVPQYPYIWDAQTDFTTWQTCRQLLQLVLSVLFMFLEC